MGGVHRTSVTKRLRWLKETAEKVFLVLLLIGIFNFEEINPSVSPLGQERVRGQALYERENDEKRGRRLG
jgi:hypothetical protein